MRHKNLQFMPVLGSRWLDKFVKISLIFDQIGPSFEIYQFKNPEFRNFEKSRHPSLNRRLSPARHWTLLVFMEKKIRELCLSASSHIRFLIENTIKRTHSLLVTHECVFWVKLLTAVMPQSLWERNVNRCAFFTCCTKSSADIKVLSWISSQNPQKSKAVEQTSITVKIHPITLSVMIQKKLSQIGDDGSINSSKFEGSHPIRRSFSS